MNAQDWVGQSACRDTDLDFFMRPDTPGFAINREACLRLCAGCPVQAECLAFAIDNREEHGIWGGKTASQREAIVFPASTYRDEVYPDNVFAPPLSA